MARDYQRNYEDGGYGSHNNDYGSSRGEQGRHDDGRGFFSRIGDTISNAWDRIAGDEEDQERYGSRHRADFNQAGSGSYDRGGYSSSSGSAAYGSVSRGHSPATDYSSGYTGIYSRGASYGSNAGNNNTSRGARGGYGSMNNWDGDNSYRRDQDEGRRERGGRSFMDSDYDASAGRGSGRREQGFNRNNGGYGAGSTGGYSGSGFGGANYSSMGRFGGSSDYGAMSGGKSSGGGMDYRNAGSSGIGSSSGYGANARGNYGSSMKDSDGNSWRDSDRRRGSGSMGGGAFGSGGGPFSGGSFGETGSMGNKHGSSSDYDRGNFDNEPSNRQDNFNGTSMRTAIYGSSYDDGGLSSLTNWAGQSRSFTEGDYGSSDDMNTGYGGSDYRNDIQRPHDYARSKGENSNEKGLYGRATNRDHDRSPYSPRHKDDY